jgi:hypothetical protein
MVLAEIDQLVVILFQKSLVNPPFYTHGLNTDARAYWDREPKAAI